MLIRHKARTAIDLVVSVAIIWLVVGVGVWYETDYVDRDSRVGTITSIFQWLGIAPAMAVTVIATWEAPMVLAALYNDAVRRQIYQAVYQWNEERKRTEARGEPFTKPLPIDYNLIKVNDPDAPDKS